MVTYNIMDSSNVNKLINVIKDIFTKKLSMNIICNSHNSISSPFLINEQFTVLSFSQSKVNTIIITSDKITAEKFHKAFNEIDNISSDNINNTFSTIAETLLIKIAMELYKTPKIYQEKLYMINSYELIEPESLYYINTYTLNFNFTIQDIGNINIYYVN